MKNMRRYCQFIIVLFLYFSFNLSARTKKINNPFYSFFIQK